MARLRCEVCRGRGWVVLGGERQDCPTGCEAGWIEVSDAAADQLGRPVPLGAAVEYWANLAVARRVLDRYGREVPEGAATSPPPDWLSWAVMLHRTLSGLVAAIGVLDELPAVGELPEAES